MISLFLFLTGFKPPCFYSLYLGLDFLSFSALLPGIKIIELVILCTIFCMSKKMSVVLF